MNEEDYKRGSRAAWLSLLAECYRQLGYGSPETQNVCWVEEREATIAALRSACDAFGDNDWNETLNLADVVEKHLERHLHHKAKYLEGRLVWEENQLKAAITPMKETKKWLRVLHLKKEIK